MSQQVRQSQLLLGLTGTVDYEIEWDSDVVATLARQAGVAAASDLDEQIRTESDLVSSVLGFIAQDRGGERHVSNTDVLVRFASRFRYKCTIGGSGVRASLALAALGYPSMVHLVSIDDTVRSLLPAEVRYFCSADADSLDPHLIVQYPADVRVATSAQVVTGVHANRLIYVNDPASRDMLLHPDLPALIAQADVFLLCGFNGMRDLSLLIDRIDQVMAGIVAMRPDAFVFYEDAGYHVPELGTAVRERVLPHCDVWSMNEDELQALIGYRFDLTDAEALAHALRDAFRLHPVRNLLVHSQYWAVIAGADADLLLPCVRHGIDVASTRFAYGDEMSEATVTQTAQLPRHPAGADLVGRLAKYLGNARGCAVPDQRWVENPTTIGLGDTFAGGFLHEYARRRDAVVPDLTPTRRM
ncbi:MAG: ADP-dependent glucokinase/phosphofructokinase [Beutenbergiaceae bacterium]